MLESALVKYGKEVLSYTIGKPHEVEFPFQIMWDYYKKQDNRDINRFHLVHVHPSQSLCYSLQDLACMKSLKMAYNGSLKFSIICFNIDIQNVVDLDWQIKTYYLNDDGNVIEVETPPLERIEIQALFLLSYSPYTLREIFEKWIN